MRAITRGAIVLGCSAALAALLWFVADTVGSPTPTPTRPGLDQPALVGLEHTVQFLAAGAVAWTACWLVARALGLGRSRRGSWSSRV